MISFLSGTVLQKHERSITLEVNGVGYLVFLTRERLEKIPEGEKLDLHIHTTVREDDISLYGFPAAEEWKFFKLLLTVSGIGPKSAMEILNAPLTRVRQAIAKKDVAALTQFPGIGKKTAERICVDLQGKLKEEILEESAAPEARNLQEDIVQALVSLGYARNQVVNGLKKIPPEVSEAEAMIKYFLQNA